MSKKIVTTMFEVNGPCEVPCNKGKVAKTITKEETSEFWQKNSSHESQKGCYVFAIRAGKGFTPHYIGKATKSFKQEIFTPHKLQYYQRVLANHKSGTPIIFFVTLPVKKGQTNVKHISELERFLIDIGVIANPELLNVQNTKQAKWGIEGVIRSNKGKPNKASSNFKQCMNI